MVSFDGGHHRLHLSHRHQTSSFRQHHLLEASNGVAAARNADASEADDGTGVWMMSADAFGISVFVVCWLIVVVANALDVDAGA